MNKQTNEQQALERALQQTAEQQNPLDQVKAIRKEQLDRCAIKRSDEIEQLLKQAKDGEN